MKRLLLVIPTLLMLCCSSKDSSNEIPPSRNVNMETYFDVIYYFDSNIKKFLITYKEDENNTMIWTISKNDFLVITDKYMDYNGHSNVMYKIDREFYITNFIRK